MAGVVRDINQFLKGFEREDLINKKVLNPGKDGVYLLQGRSRKPLKQLMISEGVDRLEYKKNGWFYDVDGNFYNPNIKTKIGTSPPWNYDDLVSEEIIKGGELFTGTNNLFNPHYNRKKEHSNMEEKKTENKQSSEITESSQVSETDKYDTNNTKERYQSKNENTNSISQATNDSSEPEIDLLNRKPLIQSLASLLMNKQTSIPLTIGLFAEWGVGKSSFLHLLHKKLDDHKSYRWYKIVISIFVGWWKSTFKEKWKLSEIKTTVKDKIDVNKKNKEHFRNAYYVRFDAAQYDNSEEAIWSALYVRLFQEKKFNSLYNKWRLFFLNFSKNNVNFSTLLLLFIFFGVGLALHRFLPEILDIFDINLEENIASLPLSTAFSTAFSIAITFAINVYKYFSYLNSKFEYNVKLSLYKKKMGYKAIAKEDITMVIKNTLKKDECLIIAIDELDRTNDEKLIEGLEAVHILKDIDQVITILSLNTRIMIEAVCNKNGQKEINKNGKERRGLEYLEKYVTLPIYLTNPESYDELLEDMFREVIEHSEETSEEDPEKIINEDTINEVVNEEGKKEDIDLSPITFTEGEKEQFLNFIRNNKGVNVRKTKVLFNILCLAKKLYEVNGIKNEHPENDFETYISYLLHKTSYVENTEESSKYEAFDKRVCSYFYYSMLQENKSDLKHQ